LAYRKTGKVVAQLEANRARIMDAARELIFDGGLTAASVAAVARKAGVATGTIYRYFPSREALLLEVFRAVSDQEMTRLEDIAAGPGRPGERLRKVVRAFVGRAVRGARQSFALLGEPLDGALAEDRLSFRRRHAAIFERLIREAVAAGDIPQMNAHVTASAITGAIPSALTLYGPDGVPEADALIDAVFRMAGLAPDTDHSSLTEDVSHDQSA
jgi:AcrR family transcriptional regulator